MAFRLLFWNIQNFTEKRIFNIKGNSQAMVMDNTQRALANRQYILTTVQEADPDVFVIVEVRCGQGNLEQLAAGNGPSGLLRLLGYMRASLSTQWCLVPPLRVNQRYTLSDTTHTEAVGVFWRYDRLSFTGPYVWPAANANSGPPIAPGTGAAAAAYPAPWDSTMAPAGIVSAMPAAAGRCRFYRPDNSEIPFCDPQADYAEVARHPFMTTFTELAGLQRTIKLFAAHTKPGISARDALAQISGMRTADRSPGTGITVYAGDFNLNLINQTPPVATTISLCQMAHMYLQETNTQNGNTPSRVLRRSIAQPTGYLHNELLDYAFVSYGAILPPPLPLQDAAVIAERVAGVPAGPILPAFTCDMATTLPNILLIAASNLVAIAAAPNGASRAADVVTITTTAPHGLNPGDAINIAGVTDPSFNQGAYVLEVTGATTFTYALEGTDATSGGGTVDTQPRLNTFRQRDNYGHICQPNPGTSDHLPFFLYT